MIKITARTALFLSISVCVLGTAGSALAQDNDTGSNRFMEEIVVTAQKRAQSADDIGMAITAIGGQDMEQLGITDTADLSRIVPGFTYGDSGLSTPIYTIRGVGYSDTAVQAQSTVGVYNDQIAVPYPIMTSGLQLDVERVEVLKGPQGTLYGRNSTGGAINYIANRPTEEFEASIKTEYGRFDTFDLTGVVSGSLSDNFGARLAIRSVQSGEGWQESLSRNEELGEQDKTAVRLLLDYAPSDRLSVNFAYNYWQDKSDTQAPQFLRSDPQRPSRLGLIEFYNSGPNPRIPIYGTDDVQAADWTPDNTRIRQPLADMQNESFSLNVSWDINDNMTLTSLTSISKFENESSYDYSGWAGIPLDFDINGLTPRDTISPIVRPLYAQDVDLGGVGFTNTSEIDAFSQELRLNGFVGNLTWLAGIYYSDDEVDNNTPQLPQFNTGTNTAHLDGGGVQSTANKGFQESTSWSVFAHTEWALNDTLNLTVGLRYTEDEKDFAGCTADNGDGDLAGLYNALFGAPIFSTPGTCTMFDLDLRPSTEFFEDELNEDSLSWRLGLDYNLSEETLLYASYSRGFKSGSFPTVTANLWQALQPVVQEQLDAFEIGVKTEFRDGTVKFNGAAFYYDYKDKQLFSKVVTFFGPANALANISESSVYGAEFDVSWYASENLFVTVGGSYTKTEVDDFQGYSQVGIEGDFSGSEFPLTPDLQAFAMINYDFEVSDGIRGFVNFDLSYTAESYSDYDIREVLDSGVNGPRYGNILTAWDVAVGESHSVADEFTLPDAVLVGASVGIASKDGKWSASLWGRNLTDEYTVSLVNKTSDAVMGWTGMPRSYGIRLGYDF